MPKPNQDRPELGRVGVIAAVGFALGVAWPWMAGVKLVPSPPTDEIAESGSASAEPSASPPVASGRPEDDATDVKAAGVADRTREETVNIGDLQVFGCRDGKGKKLKDCDKVAFDGIAHGRLSALAACDDAKGAKDTLSIGFELDFEKKAIAEIFSGKSSTFSKEKAKGLVECAKKEFESVRLDDLEHEHEEYTVFYFVEFVPPGTVTRPASSAAAPEDETADASGLATVGWDVAVVRDEPETGKILTRLRFGTRVVVTARRGKWYRVKYDAKGTLGWVHRNALGL